MASAYCPSCSETITWSARRGHKLADLRCPKCNGPLQGKTKGKESPAKGASYTVCVHCGRRNLHPAIPPREFTVRGKDGHVTYAAGTPVCTVHEPALWARVGGTLRRMRFSALVVPAGPFEEAADSDLEINIFGTRYAMVWRWTERGWIEEEHAPVLLRELAGGAKFLIAADEPGSLRESWKVERGELVELGAGTVVPASAAR